MPHRVAAALLGICLLAPAAHGQTWRLVEEWRVGGEVEGAYSFHDVRALERLPNGGIVVLEYRDQQIHFLDSRGRPVRTVGRMGAGPGEYQNARGLVVLPNGNLVINDPDNNRFTLLGPTGDLIRTIPMDQTRGFGGFWDAWAEPDGRVGERISVRRGEEWVRARQLWSPDFTKSDTLYAAECPPLAFAPVEARSYSFRSARGGRIMMIPYAAPTLGSIYAPDGGLWYAPWPGYGGITHTPAGRCTPTTTITLAERRVAIPKASRDSAVALVTEAASRFGPPGPDLDLIPRIHPPFDAIRLDQSGRLWVTRQRTPTQREFEVYGRDGKLLARLDLPATLEPLRPMIITADRLYGFETDEDDLPYLVAYRVVK